MPEYTTIAKVQSQTWAWGTKPIRHEYEIARCGDKLVIRMLDWPACPRVEPLSRFVREWPGGRNFRRIFRRLGHQRFEVLDGAVIESRGHRLHIHGGPLDGRRF